MCGGAVNSPQLLMLSGIGDRDQLAEHGIDVVHHAPEVGENLTDHSSAPLGFDVPNDTLFAAEKPLQLVNYLIRRRGMLTSNVAEAYGFVRSRPDLELPDLELMFAPAPFFDEGIGTYGGHASWWGDPAEAAQPRQHLVAVTDPKDKPIIDPRYLTDEAGVDRATMMDGLRICARIAKSPALQDVIGTIAQAASAHRTSTTRRSKRHSTRCSHTALSPGRHVPDGQRRRQRGGSAAAGSRRRRTAGGRRVGDADDHSRAHPRTQRADRREGGRSDSVVRCASGSSAQK